MTTAPVPAWRRTSRATRTVVIMGAILLLLAMTGALRADRGIEITSQEAIEIATGVVDFEPENVQVRLIRQGIGLRPVWAVSLAVPQPGSNDFSRLATVEVDAIDGDVLRTVTSP